MRWPQVTLCGGASRSQRLAGEELQAEREKERRLTLFCTKAPWQGSAVLGIEGASGRMAEGLQIEESESAERLGEKEGRATGGRVCVWEGVPSTLREGAAADQGVTTPQSPCVPLTLPSVPCSSLSHGQALLKRLITSFSDLVLDLHVSSCLQPKPPLPRPEELPKSCNREPACSSPPQRLSALDRQQRPQARRGPGHLRAAFCRQVFNELEPAQM